MISYNYILKQVTVTDDTNQEREPLILSTDLTQAEIESAILNYLGSSAIAVPQIISRRQAFLSMAASNILLTIKTYINSLNETDPARITWETAVEFHRNDDMINSLAPLLGLTNQQIDELFILGATL